MNDETNLVEQPDLQAEYAAFLSSPEYLAALNTEGSGRELSFMTGPETVAGISLRQITPRDLLVLQQIGTPLLASAFVNGKRKPVDCVPEMFNQEFAETHLLVEPGAIASFLWIQSVDFVPLTSWCASRRWHRFIRRVRALPYGATCEAIRRYVEDAMADQPGGSGSGGASVASWIAGMVHVLAKEYHWSEAAILDLPIKRIFQYERCIIASRGDNAALFSRADALRGDWLKMINERAVKRRAAE